MDKDIGCLSGQLIEAAKRICDISAQMEDRDGLSEDTVQMLEKLRFDGLEQAQQLLLVITGMLASNHADDMDEIHKRKDESAFFEGELNEVKDEEVEGHGTEAN